MVKAFHLCSSHLWNLLMLWGVDILKRHFEKCRQLYFPSMPFSWIFICSWKTWIVLHDLEGAVYSAWCAEAPGIDFMNFGLQWGVMQWKQHAHCLDDISWPKDSAAPEIQYLIQNCVLIGINLLSVLKVGNDVIIFYIPPNSMVPYLYFSR